MNADAPKFTIDEDDSTADQRISEHEYYRGLIRDAVLESVVVLVTLGEHSKALELLRDLIRREQ